MIIVTEPVIRNLPMSRKAVSQVMAELNLSYEIVTDRYVMIKLSDEDAVAYTLLDAGQKIYDRYWEIVSA
jgi:hypothetical protein